MRSLVLVGGSVGIGAGVALGWFGLAPALVLAFGLATGQVLAQTMLQNKLGQDVMGGVAGGDLARALASAETALAESPAGPMRTLAAANLASVLMQADRIADGASVLDRFPPHWPHAPVSTVLWNNNRAFAALVQYRDAGFAGALLDDAEKRLQKAGVRGFGGVHNFRKIGAAVAGTRAMQALQAGDPKAALTALEHSHALDEAVTSTFRAAERELCRAEALRRLGRRDEALLLATTLRELSLTRRQTRALEALEQRLGLQRSGAPALVGEVHDGDAESGDSERAPAIASTMSARSRVGASRVGVEPDDVDTDTVDG
jgi:tetratricopeptide (TPR) repeat protein